MLQTIKEQIKNAPSVTFGDYYQTFVIESQNRIIENSMSMAKYKVPESIDGALDLIANMNKLSEELIK